MHAAIRCYRTDSNLYSELVKQALDDFVPRIKELQGLLAYYAIDTGNGVVATISICENEEQVDATNRMATEWLRQYLVTSVFSNGEIQELSLQVDDSIQGPLYEGFSEPVYKRDLQLLSVQEVCEVLGMGRSWVYQQIRSGEMPSVHLGGNVKVLRKDLQEYLAERRHPLPIQK